MAVSPCIVLCPAYARVSTRHSRTWRRRSVTGASVLGCADGALSGAWSVHGRGYHTTEARTPRPRDHGGKTGDGWSNPQVPKICRAYAVVAGPGIWSLR